MAAVAEMQVNRRAVHHDEVDARSVKVSDGILHHVDRGLKLFLAIGINHFEAVDDKNDVLRRSLIEIIDFHIAIDAGVDPSNASLPLIKHC